ncbi:MAG: alpha-E domain-containing protein [Dehalococcoidia bacterium]
MLARVAENLYWLGRLLERADNMARLTDVSFAANVEAAPPMGADEAVVAALGQRRAFEEAREHDPDLDARAYLVFSAEHAGSLRSTVRGARSLARETREHLSREVFEELNRLYLELERAASVADPDSDFALQAFCSTVKHSTSAIQGLIDNTMLVTEGTSWLRCGVALERADMTSRMIDTKYFVLLPEAADVGGPIDRFQWMVLLRSVSALEAYRKRYRGGVSGPNVARLLIYDRGFPRSLVSSVNALVAAYEEATRETPSARRRRALREILMLQLDLEAGTVDVAIEQGLHEFLDEVQRRLALTNEALAADLFRAIPEGVAG